MSDHNLLTSHISTLNEHFSLLCRLKSDFSSAEDANAATNNLSTNKPDLQINMGLFKERVKHCIKDAEDLKRKLDSIPHRRGAHPALSGSNPAEQAFSPETQVSSPKRRRLLEGSTNIDILSASDRARQRQDAIETESCKDEVIQPDDTNDTSMPSQPSPVPTTPALVVEYEDIDAEVEDRLRANEERRRRNANGETNPSVKRKREARSSTASRDSIPRAAKVNIRANDAAGSHDRQSRKKKRPRTVLDQVPGNSAMDSSKRQILSPGKRIRDSSGDRWAFSRVGKKKKVWE